MSQYKISLFLFDNGDFYCCPQSSALYLFYLYIIYIIIGPSECYTLIEYIQSVCRTVYQLKGIVMDQPQQQSDIGIFINESALCQSMFEQIINAQQNNEFQLPLHRLNDSISLGRNQSSANYDQYQNSLNQKTCIKKKCIKKNFPQFLARNITQLLRKVLQIFRKNNIQKNSLKSYIENNISSIKGTGTINQFIFLKTKSKDRQKNLGFSLITIQLKAQIRQIFLKNIEFFRKKAINKFFKNSERRSAYFKYIDLFQKSLDQGKEIQINKRKDQCKRLEEWHQGKASKQNNLVLNVNDLINREEEVQRMVSKKISPLCAFNLQIKSMRSKSKQK